MISLRFVFMYSIMFRRLARHYFNHEMIVFLSRIRSHAVAVISVAVSLIQSSKLGRFNKSSDEPKEAGGGQSPTVCIAKKPYVAKENKENFYISNIFLRASLCCHTTVPLNQSWHNSNVPS